jgi:predicted AAA+ superfamily ATPase
LKKIWDRLSKFSGFPEPYLAAKPQSYRRWTTTYHHQLIREDIRDLTDVKSIDNLEILFALLPSKTGAPLSIPNLAGDLKVTYNTIKNWLMIFDRFYLTFTLMPWAQQIERAIHKERKTYLFDYALIQNEGSRFENMVAVELFRAVSNWNDSGYGSFSLHYIRTKEGREVDFLIANGSRPMMLIEAKIGRQAPSANLIRFQKTLGIPAIQLTEQGEGFKLLNKRSLLIAPAYEWLASLP